MPFSRTIRVQVRPVALEHVRSLGDVCSLEEYPLDIGNDGDDDDDHREEGRIERSISPVEPQ